MALAEISTKYCIVGYFCMVLVKCKKFEDCILIVVLKVVL